MDTQSEILVAPRLAAIANELAALLWCPHPELESHPQPDRNPLKPISQTGS